MGTAMAITIIAATDNSPMEMITGKTSARRKKTIVAGKMSIGRTSARRKRNIAVVRKRSGARMRKTTRNAVDEPVTDTTLSQIAQRGVHPASNALIPRRGVR
jgi:hypothetical protein